MPLNSDRVKAGIYTGLVLAANHFAEKEKAKIREVNVPQAVADSIVIGSPVQTGEGTAYIDIETGGKDAPMATAFEYGSGLHGKKAQRYLIEPKNKQALAFPWEVARNLSPSFTGKATGGIELSKEGKAFLPRVMHPGVAARPFIRPTLQEQRAEIRKILGREFVASIRLGGTVEIIQ